MSDEAWARWEQKVDRRLGGLRPWLLAFWGCCALMALSWVVLFVVLGPAGGA